MTQNRTSTAVTVKSTDLCNKNIKMLKTIENQGNNSDYVPHITPADVKLMCIVAAKSVRGTPKDKQNAERTAALVRLIFDACLRVSEALQVRMCDITETPSGWVVAILGKGSKPGLAAVNVETVNVLSRFAYDYQLAKADLLFPISRSTAFRNIQAVYLKAGLRLPSVDRDRCGCVHILRHSGCLARLALSGSPREVQIQLRHKSASMTLRYQKTLTAIEGLKNQQAVNVWQG
ncbi:MAG: site-specific integrase [Dehalococcoidales bacterium]